MKHHMSSIKYQIKFGCVIRHPDKNTLTLVFDQNKAMNLKLTHYLIQIQTGTNNFEIYGHTARTSGLIESLHISKTNKLKKKSSAFLIRSHFHHAAT